MAYFAKINNSGIVENVISINNCVIMEPENSFPETEPLGVDFILNTLGLDGEWKQTSYNNNFRKHYAGIGYYYDKGLDAFIPPRPYPSWILDTVNCLWQSPIPYPNDGKNYEWDESTISWKEIINDPV